MVAVTPTRFATTLDQVFTIVSATLGTAEMVPTVHQLTLVRPTKVAVGSIHSAHMFLQASQAAFAL